MCTDSLLPNVKDGGVSQAERRTGDHRCTSSTAVNSVTVPSRSGPVWTTGGDGKPTHTSQQSRTGRRRRTARTYLRSHLSTGFSTMHRALCLLAVVYTLSITVVSCATPSQRAHALLAQMTQAEKITMLHGSPLGGYVVGSQNIPCSTLVLYFL